MAVPWFSGTVPLSGVFCYPWAVALEECGAASKELLKTLLFFFYWEIKLFMFAEDALLCCSLYLLEYPK